MKRPLLCTFLCSAFTLVVAGQSIEERVLRSTDGEQIRSKQIHQTLLDLDGQATFSFHGDVLKVRMERSISSARLIQALQENGAGAFHEMTSAGSEANDPFPEYVDTGHPEQDMIDFALAKQTWMEANPEAFQRLMEAQRRTIQLDPDGTR